MAGRRARIPWDLLARAARTAPAALGALGAALLLLQLVVEAIERRIEWSAPLARERITVRGFELLPEGTLRGTPSPDGFHALETLIDFGRLGKLRDYDVRFDILDAASTNVVLRVDFFAAPSYDGPAQERSREVGVESVGSRVALRINSGWVPRQAYLRLVYFGPPGLALGPIHFRPTPILLDALERGLHWVGLALLFAAGWLALTRRAEPGSPAGADVGMPHAAWPLIAIYLATALGHVALHLFAPLWRGDELQYKSLAAALWWLAPGEALAPGRIDVPIDLPGRLYPYLISPALAARGEFYGALRLINALVMSSVVFPTFAIGRRYLPRSAALFVAGLSAALPFAQLSAYAVTEVAFFPLYVTAAWLTLESVLAPRRLGWILALGCAAAIALCARPSGGVILPAFLACHAWGALRSGSVGELVRRPRWLLALAAFGPVFLGVQWLTGVEALASSGVYASTLDARPPLLESTAGLLDLALGHLTTLSIPFALPLALLFHGARTRSGAEPLCIVAAVFFGALFALALGFTVLVSGTDLGGLGRWHARYYFAGYPLLLLAGAAVLAARPSVARRSVSVAAVVALLLAAHLGFMQLRPASQSVWFGALVDNMDVHWYGISGGLRWLLLAATVLLTWLWHRGDDRLVPAATALAVLWIVVANQGTAVRMRIGDRLAPDPCGRLTTSFLELRPGSFAIVGSDPRFREGAMFWTPYLPSFTGSAAEASRYLAGSSASDLDFIVTDGSDPSDPRFGLRVDAGPCRIYGRRS